ncbi:hypothetical protein HFMG06CAA_0355 [Mycoplasmoides gallisepticum CA06_2006.052-5-2P]|uniref:Uncharacterized protein n=3 Tax=Mycoplasmoides gallisepticum TaxID=2096 RepID=Q7NC37_MYCGA|nr:unique hypothetical protein [Mycoplasmoides gallisepticum str. R(low)]ADC30230.1 hypothetical protein MGAH_0702 [Mycoplasmoides gallisepticum str. R(high)]ADC30996.1 hypothetical protein MGF_0362 [Mycoplasmoides gallisepticum str. F]AFP76453.1 hypothetical protein HFMG95NCA_0358 [Mycoplasmoides gallisepticum NC95_13295-2-2P]AFP77207.1 hypothetical protein HFMG96NCA_0358 [Mycoplasmoides gallisepticum NC96_1596-4-2P]AFP78738.1 hypothetical protein HFMG01WIA_0359 [Mycoplasmoides gallisepticum 
MVLYGATFNNDISFKNVHLLGTTKTYLNKSKFKKKSFYGAKLKKNSKNIICLIGVLNLSNVNKK